MVDSPNLLFVWTDQQTAATMQAYGNDRIETPTLDGLADESILFENAYVTQSVCGPSRASNMTGKYPHAIGVTENNVALPPGSTCFPEFPGFEEYRSAFIGKWHLGDEIFRQHGFDEWVSLEDQYWPFYSEERPTDAHSTYHHFLVDNGFEPDETEENGFEWFTRSFCANLPEEYSKPAYLAREASRFIHENRDVPFILHVMFLEPHQPYASPRDDQYRPSDVDLPENFVHPNFDDQPLKIRLSRAAIQGGAFRPPPDVLGPSPDEEGWRRLISNYWGLVSLVDTHVGTILDTLTECDLDEQTVCVYTSDHGDMLGSHGLLSKMTQFEEAVKVPLLLKIPGHSRNGTRVSDPVSQIDLVPTLLEAMGRPTPDTLDGHSWLPYLNDEGPLVEENVFIQWNGPHALGVQARHPLSDRPWVETSPRPHPRQEFLEIWMETLADDEEFGDLTEAEIMRHITTPVRTVVTPDGWKLNYRRDGEHELFDLDADPHEIENLADAPEHADTFETLADEIFEWQARVRDPVYL